MAKKLRGEKLVFVENEKLERVWNLDDDCVEAADNRYNGCGEEGDACREWNDDIERFERGDVLVPGEEETENEKSGKFMAMQHAIEVLMSDARIARETKAIYQLMLAQDSYEVLQKSMAQSEENFRIVNAKYEQGRVSEYDKISAEVQMRNLKPSVISARNAVELSMLQLKVLMGITADVDIVVEGSLKDYEQQLYGDMLTLDSLSLANNTSLLQLDMNSQLLQNSLEVQNTSFMPTVALQFNYMYTCMANDFDFKNYSWNPYSNVALSISIPLFKYSNFSNVKKTRLQQTQLQLNRDYTERQLRMQMNTYVNNMTASAEQVSSNKEAIVQAQKGRDIAQTLYDVGRGTVLELNSAEVALTQSELTYSQSVFDWLTAKADLDKLVGKDYILPEEETEK